MLIFQVGDFRTLWIAWLGTLGSLVNSYSWLHPACRHDLQQHANVPNLVGGVTFALDLSQAFDTVSLQEIICLLLAEGANGDTTSVETTAGIKQGCNKLAPTLFSFLTGTLFRSLINTFGVEQVVNFLTGYADDLTLHRTIRSEGELRAVHQLIAALLEEVKAHQHSCKSEQVRTPCQTSRPKATLLLDH